MAKVFIDGRFREAQPPDPNSEHASNYYLRGEAAKWKQSAARDQQARQATAAEQARRERANNRAIARLIGEILKDEQ